ncbi:TetR/AcrR family transcriptional regulator [Chryseobacterium sp. 2987]|uniref:TetR/AcrR family transcriptional regulator n=1 Tax=Chryseobacterium sp. 2987 TaxID=2817767 RepID=UPI0028592C80|nr:TetR/AcrR family transcriptional regulator [Chryseobacterium sp. 2987]MDR6922736.1 hypothetical protein [Chryseobacterium sp. 2987]
MRKIKKTRKEVEGPIRNKEVTKGKLINALGEIIKEEGFSSVNLVKIAKIAGCDKKLIYEYFGDLNGLAEEYFKKRNFWGKLFSQNNHTKTNTSCRFLEKQFECLMNDGEMRGVIAWELSKELPILKDQSQKREKQIEKVVGNKEGNFRAIEAILMGGIYYLTIHSHTNESTFRGIDLKQQEGQQEIMGAVKQILDWAHKEN